MQPTNCPTCGALAHPPRYTLPTRAEKIIFVVGMGLAAIAGLALYFGLAAAAGVL
jgi:cytochrome b subunit of formate dehydrogenase